MRIATPTRHRRLVHRGAIRFRPTDVSICRLLPRESSAAVSRTGAIRRLPTRHAFCPHTTLDLSVRPLRRIRSNAGGPLPARVYSPAEIAARRRRALQQRPGKMHILLGVGGASADRNAALRRNPATAAVYLHGPRRFVRATGIPQFRRSATRRVVQSTYYRNSADGSILDDWRTMLGQSFADFGALADQVLTATRR